MIFVYFIFTIVLIVGEQRNTDDVVFSGSVPEISTEREAASSTWGSPSLRLEVRASPRSKLSLPPVSMAKLNTAVSQTVQSTR